MELVEAILRLVEHACNAVSANHAGSRDLVLSTPHPGGAGEPSVGSGSSRTLRTIESHRLRDGTRERILDTYGARQLGKRASPGPPRGRSSAAVDHPF